MVRRARARAVSAHLVQCDRATALRPRLGGNGGGRLGSACARKRRHQARLSTGVRGGAAYRATACGPAGAHARRQEHHRPPPPARTAGCRRTRRRGPPPPRLPPASTKTLPAGRARARREARADLPREVGSGMGASSLRLDAGEAPAGPAQPLPPSHGLSIQPRKRAHGPQGAQRSAAGAAPVSRALEGAGPARAPAHERWCAPSVVVVGGTTISRWNCTRRDRDPRLGRCERRRRRRRCCRCR